MHIFFGFWCGFLLFQISNPKPYLLYNKNNGDVEVKKKMMKKNVQEKGSGLCLISFFFRKRIDVMEYCMYLCILKVADFFFLPSNQRTHQKKRREIEKRECFFFFLGWKKNIEERMVLHRCKVKEKGKGEWRRDESQGPPSPLLPSFPPPIQRKNSRLEKV